MQGKEACASGQHTTFALGWLRCYAENAHDSGLCLVVHDTGSSVMSGLMS